MVCICIDAKSKCRLVSLAVFSVFGGTVVNWAMDHWNSLVENILLKLRTLVPAIQTCILHFYFVPYISVSQMTSCTFMYHIDCLSADFEGLHFSHQFFKFHHPVILCTTVVPQSVLQGMDYTFSQFFYHDISQVHMV